VFLGVWGRIALDLQLQLLLLLLQEIETGVLAPFTGRSFG